MTIPVTLDRIGPLNLESTAPVRSLTMKGLWFSTAHHCKLDLVDRDDVSEISWVARTRLYSTWPAVLGSVLLCRRLRPQKGGVDRIGGVARDQRSKQTRLNRLAQEHHAAVGKGHMNSILELASQLRQRLLDITIENEVDRRGPGTDWAPSTTINVWDLRSVTSSNRVP